MKRRVQNVSREMMQFFLKYQWPGNVRELEHVIEGAMNMVGEDEIIEMSHLPDHFGKATLQPVPSRDDNASPFGSSQALSFETYAAMSSFVVLGNACSSTYYNE